MSDGREEILARLETARARRNTGFEPEPQWASRLNAPTPNLIPAQAALDGDARLKQFCDKSMALGCSLEVVADVFKDGKRHTMTFNDVRIVGVHKDYDVAMIKVKLPDGVTMRALKLPAREPVVGEECYVIGNPGGAAGEALRNSMSAGIVSASERTVEGREYIQTSAAINPGNSGGALVDKRGRVLGIISFVISERQSSIILIS